MDLFDGYTDTKIPILLLNGDLDPQTGVKWARNAALKLNANKKGVNRYYIEIPNAPHVILSASPIKNYTDDSPYQTERDFESCGMYITKSFIDNPYSKPDTQCLNWLLPLDWKVSMNITKKVMEYSFFQTVNAWGHDHNK